MKRIAVALLGCIILQLAATVARAAEPWKTLPPTPQLPSGTVSHYATLNGARIWYAQWGNTRQRTPVLLLHGGYANSNYFGYLIPFLVEHGYRVIAMDSRGHGRSARTNAPYSYELMASDVVGLLDTLAIKRVDLVGWSDGAIIGYELAIHFPGRLARLYAFGGTSELSGLTDTWSSNPVFKAYLRRVAVEYRDFSPTPDEWDSFNAALSRMWDTQPTITAAQLHSITVPTTIADGQYDEANRPEQIRYIAATIPGATLVILPNVSHFAMLQDPAEFNAAVLAFLQH
jgi:pimeloyl-ACP methyl ester carboxylesterase